jgi:hypothetical protein
MLCTLLLFTNKNQEILTNKPVSNTGYSLQASTRPTMPNNTVTSNATGTWWNGYFRDHSHYNDIRWVLRGRNLLLLNRGLLWQKCGVDAWEHTT